MVIDNDADSDLNPQMTKREKIRILEQARMVVNERVNENNFRQNISDTFRIFDKLLKQYGSSVEFQNSLSNSKNIFDKKIGTLKGLNELEINKSDSFLIVPIGNKENLFTCLVRKLTQNNQENYSAIIANMSTKDKHQQFHEYLFTNSQDIYFALLIANTSLKVSEEKVSRIYKIFEDISTEQYTQNLVSRDQSINNCFIKEVEKGIKLATVPVEVLQNTRNAKDFKEPMSVKFSINGMRIPTDKIHSDYVNILKQENPSISVELEKIRENYVFNKSFRDNIKTGKIISNENEAYDLAKNLNYKSLEFCLDNPFKSIRFGIAHLESNPKIAATISDILRSLSKIRLGINSFKEKNNNLFNDTLRQIRSTDFKSKYPYLEKELNVKVSEVYFNLGSKYNDIDSKKALNYYTKAFEFNPEKSEISQRIGIINYNMQEYQTAVKYFEVANQINPTDKIIISHLGYSYFALGIEYIKEDSIVEGLQYMDKALELNLTNKKQVGEIYYQMGEVHYNECDFDKAMELFNKAESLFDKKSPFSIEKRINDCQKEILNYNKVISNEISIRNFDFKRLKGLAKKLENQDNPNLKTLHDCYRLLFRKDSQKRDFYSKRLNEIESDAKKVGIELGDKGAGITKGFNIWNVFKGLEKQLG